MENHTGEAKIYKCELCEYTTHYRAGLKYHKAAKHTFTVPKVKCEKCECIIAKSSYKNHLKRHDAVKKHECKKCKMRFLYPTYLRKHEETTHSSVGKWTCNQCKTSYKARSALKTHIEEVHEQKRYACPKCNKTSTSKGNLRQHIKNVHTNRGKKFSCPRCERQYCSVETLKEHIESHRNIGKNCAHCEKQFTSKRGVQQHIRTKRCPVLHGIKEWSCEECIITFAKEGRYMRHLESVHKIETGRQLIKCEMCSQGYPGKSALKNHIMNSHLQN